MTSVQRRLGLLAVLAVAALARLGVMAGASGIAALNDPDGYLTLARSIAEGRGFCLEPGIPTAYRPPLYPILLAPAAGLLDGKWLAAAVGAMHLGFGLATVALVYLTAARWGLGPARGLAAAAIVAVDPVVLLQARSVMTETLAALLVAAGLAALSARSIRSSALGGGLVFGLASLCRPSLLPGAGLVALFLLARGPGTWRARAALAAGFVGGIVLCLAPWAIRNAIHFGEPVWTTTHGGYTLALANNPAYYDEVVDGPPGAVWGGARQKAWFEQITRETAGMTQPEADRALRAAGWRMLRDRPGSFLRATVARLGRFWGVAPSASVYPKSLVLATAAWTIPLWIAVVVGLARRGMRTWPAAAGVMVIVGLTVVHAFYWTDLRMRVPVMPAIALIAAGAAMPSREKSEGTVISAGQTRAIR